ncbi:2972_t:CDS:10 [Acaulospora morrowiae]|uniref:2972_t:CDS:1 n=1 Tax=Acaulospora morrowiae TaxID=94023 RepID=A0A9N9FJC3_9GLOM|nr:2972_t:CDS:10 [Acaulospora morrowiae]
MDGHNYNPKISTIPTNFCIQNARQVLVESSYGDFGMSSSPPSEPYLGQKGRKFSAFKDLKENLIGESVSIRGLVTRISGIKLLASEVMFTCMECKGLQQLEFDERRYYPPFKCKTYGCRSKEFIPNLKFDEEKGQKSYEDVQDIRIDRLQEVLGDSDENLILPKIIDCELRSKLVDAVKPGDFVTVIGILRVYETPAKERTKKGTRMHHLYIDVEKIRKITIIEHFSSWEITEGIAAQNDGFFSLKDLYMIKNFIECQSNNIFKRIVNSYCPNVYGQELVKAGILLSIFGGIDNGTINVLIVGDPGTDKADLLQAASSISPHTVFTPVSQGGSTPILPTLYHEKLRDDWILDAGTLVLSNAGICRIDDFEKIGQSNALAEAMSRMSISISKAGVKGSLNAKTSIIATANPVSGHYDKSKFLSENLKIGNAILSNFDLVFLLLDIPDEEMDHYLSERVMTIHSGAFSNGDLYKGQIYVPSIRDINRSRAADILPLSEKLKIGMDDENKELLDNAFLQKYVVYAHKYVQPRLSREAREMIKLFFANMGNKYRSMNDMPITTRQLETMIKLSQARARMELRETVIVEDVEDVAEIMEFCLFRIQRDENSRAKGKSKAGKRSGKQAETKRYEIASFITYSFILKLIYTRFLEELGKISNAKRSDIFTYQELKQFAIDSKLQYDDFQGFIESLNDQSLLLKKGLGKFQLRFESN